MEKHPRVRGKTLSWAQFAHERHVVVMSGTDQHLVKNLLEPRGIQYHVQLTVGGFLAMPWLIKDTEFLATIPSRLAYDFAHIAELRILPLPEPVAP